MRTIPLLMLAAAMLGPLAHAGAPERTERLEPAVQVSPGTRFFDWTDSRTLRPVLGADGGLGLLRLPTADLGTPGVLRLQVLAEGFRARNFPVLNAVQSHFGGRLSASYVALPWLEAFLTFSAAANNNDTATRPTILSLGSLEVGLKGALQLAPGLFGGVEARALAYPSGLVQSGRFAGGFWPRALLGYDLRSLTPYLPLRLHMAAGVRFDWNQALPGEDPQRAADDYALDTHRYHRFTFGAGAEIPFPWVAPFFEYNLASALGVPGQTLASPDGTTLTPTQAIPHSVSAGLRVTAVKSVTFLLATEFGLNRRVALGMASVPPFNFFAAVSLDVDLLARPDTRVVEIAYPQSSATSGLATVEGQVVDAEGHASLGGVMVTFPATELPPVATDALNGRFRTYGLVGTETHLRFSREGYLPKDVTIALVPGRPSVVQVELTAQPRRATLVLRAFKQGKPIDALVQIQGETSHSVRLSANSAEPTRVELSPGTYTLQVQADGSLSQTREVQLPDAGTLTSEFELKPLPKKPMVVLRGNKIELTQTVHFVTGKAKLLGDSFTLLQQVVDVLIRNKIGKIRIEGHTDNAGSAAFNQKLSEARAKSVADYLVSQGIDRARLDPKGFGGSRPVAPNLTARGRELNRRVEFIVVSP